MKDQWIGYKYNCTFLVIRTTWTFFTHKSTTHLTVEVSVKSGNRSHTRIKYFPIQLILCLSLACVPTSPKKLHFFSAYTDTKDAFVSIFTDLTDNIRMLLSRRIQESPQIHQSGCKEVCMHFLREMHMGDYSFKEPGLLVRMLFFFIIIILSNLLALSLWKAGFCMLLAKVHKTRVYKQLSQTSQSLRAVSGTSRTFSDGREWMKSMPTTHICGTTHRLKEPLFKRSESSIIMSYTKHMNFESVSPLLPASKNTSGCL